MYICFLFYRDFCAKKFTFLHLSERRCFMRIEYSQLFNQYHVDGLGYFDTLKDAKNAINKNDKLIVSVTKDMKEQLKQIAKVRKITVSDIVRQAIKEVIANGK